MTIARPGRHPGCKTGQRAPVITQPLSRLPTCLFREKSPPLLERFRVLHFSGVQLGFTKKPHQPQAPLNPVFLLLQAQRATPLHSGMDLIFPAVVRIQTFKQRVERLQLLKRGPGTPRDSPERKSEVEQFMDPAFSRVRIPVLVEALPKPGLGNLFPNRSELPEKRSIHLMNKINILVFI